MFGGHGAGQFSIRPDSSSPFASPVQQVPAQRRASLGQLESRILSMGGDLLHGASRQGQEPCLRFARLGPALVENCLEDVAGAHALRRRPTRTQSNQTWFMGAATGEQGRRLSQNLIS